MTDQPPRTPTGTGAVPQQHLARVLADASERTGVPRDRLEVVRAQAVQWRDGSLGCPEPGMSYIQMIVDGFWVELVADGSRLDYRMDGRGNFRLCDRPARTPPYSTDR